MKWVPLAVVLILLLLAVLGARYMPEKIAENELNVLEDSPVKKCSRNYPTQTKKISQIIIICNSMIE